MGVGKFASTYKDHPYRRTMKTKPIQFHNMQLSPGTHLQMPQLRAALHRISTRRQFIPRKAPYTNTDRVQYYGYAITDAWLFDYAQKHEHLLRPGAKLVDDFGRMSFAIDVLRSQTGMYKLLCHWGRPPKVLPPGVEIGPDNEILVLTVVSTRADSWETRPSQAQVDLLQSIMEDKKLRWWKDWYPSEG
ncbi:hypothetical protein BV25DRAFT_1828801 [Artomyces pyxidatus]|uniref:Uncharacterized protein n=1 Tax=Artomyces pyxidatus TaxID=48021 RepID=A0ACB8STS3_9AGAM|nr:hypothetical protein BV25DRAFT_1828801 [Artomyces pyxidatus]